MATDGLLNQLNASTSRYIRKAGSRLVDDIFQSDGLLAYARVNLREDFDGGRVVPEDFLYAGMIGGSYLKGKEFNISERQVEQQAQFEIKFFEVNITLSKEDIQVLNAGRAARYKLVTSRVNAAYLTIGAHKSIALYLNGINAGYTSNFNGLPEALNDNVTASWDGNLYANYGGLARSSTAGGKLVSAPQNINGTIEYQTLEEQYGAASLGNGEYEPNLLQTTFLGYSYIKEKFQTQQRFQDTQDPKIGFNGMKFNSATILRSRYVPGSFLSAAVVGDTDGSEVAADYLSESSGGAVAAYPTLTGETLWMLNARKPFFNFYLSVDEEYGLGFTGWKPGQGNTKVAGQVLFGGAVTFHPRYHRQLYAITG